MAIKPLADKTGGTRCQVDQLVDDIGIHSGNEVFKVQVQIINTVVEFGGVVVTQVFRIQMLQVGGSLDESALGLGHLGSVHRDIAVYEDVARFPETGPFEHGWPEQ